MPQPRLGPGRARTQRQPMLGGGAGSRALGSAAFGAAEGSRAVTVQPGALSRIVPGQATACP